MIESEPTVATHDQYTEPEPEPIEIAWETWVPSPGSKSFQRVSESNFDGTNVWADHVVDKDWNEVHPSDIANARHRLHKRQLPDGRWVGRPMSFLGDDQIYDSQEAIQA